MEILNQIKNKNILVFGDVILDKYIFCRTIKMSHEAPIPVVEIKNREYRLGGAGNVAANISSLGASVTLVGTCGNDEFSNEITKLLKEKNINNKIIYNEKNETIVKSRIISDKKQLLRIDKEKLYKPEKNHIIDGKYDGIIISDYAKGTISKYMIDKLKNKAIKDNIPIFLDPKPKPKNKKLYHDFTTMTPNKDEAEKLLNRKLNSLDKAKEFCLILKKKYTLKYSIITLAEDGMAVYDGNKFEHILAEKHDVFDVTGCGDCVIALTMLAYCASKDIFISARFANYGAGIVGTKSGASQVTIKEMENFDK